MKFRKPLAAATGLILASMGLVACSSVGNDNAVTDANAPVTLTILSPLVVEAPEADVEKAYAAEYEAAHPNVTIEFVGVPMNDAYAKISTLATGGAMPDIFVNSPEFSAQANELGIVADMSTLLGDDFMSGFAAAPLKQATLNDKVQFAPYFTIPTGLLYRTDLFEAAGLTPPTTWDEFRDDAEKLTVDTNSDGQTDRWGFAMVGTNNGSGGSRFLPIMRTFGAQELYQDGDTWKTGFNTPEAIASFNLYGNLVADGSVPPGPLQTGYAEATTEMATDKAAMMVTGPHTIGAILAQNPELEGKLAGAPLPAASGESSVSVLGMLGWSISEDSKHKDVAADYIKFQLNKKNQLAWNAATGRLPARTDALEDPQIARPELAGFIAAQDNAFTLPNVSYYPNLQVIAANAYQAVIIGQMSAKDAAADAASKTETDIANNN